MILLKKSYCLLNRVRLVTEHRMLKDGAVNHILMAQEAKKKRKRIRKSKEKEGQQDPLMQCGTPWYKILGSFSLVKGESSV